MVRALAHTGLVVSIVLAIGQTAEVAAATPTGGNTVTPVVLPASGTETSPEAIEQALEKGLESDGLNLEDVDVSPDEVSVEVESADRTDDSEFDLVIESDGTATFTVTDVIDGHKASTTFLVDIQTMTEDGVVFDLVNPKTGETLHYDSDQPIQSLVWVIPIALGAIGLGTILKWIAVGTAIVIGTVLFVAAAKAVSNIMTAYRAEQASKRRDFYPAMRQGNKVFIDPIGMTDAQATKRGKAGQDVWAVTSARAKTLCNWVRSPAVGPEVHGKTGSGFLYHYHPYNRSPGTHCFYGGPL